MKYRLAIVAHYDKDGLADPCFLFLLRGLYSVVQEIIVVSTAPLREQEAGEIRELATLICRANAGYDCYSWKVGLQSVRTPEIYDAIITCNDSVYGPLSDLHKIFSSMDKKM